MSVASAIRRKTAPEIRARKGGEPIVMLTSYHAHTAALVDRHCDVILVGDSLGNVMHGFETTVPVTIEMMILQGRAVMRGSSHALVVVDMPFGSYEASREQAFHSAVKIMKETQCGAVKLEGGARMADTVAFLSQRGIPVMGHIGLTPQSINALGSFRAQGREEGSWEPIENDAGAISQGPPGDPCRGVHGGRLRRPGSADRRRHCQFRFAVESDHRRTTHRPRPCRGRGVPPGRVSPFPPSASAPAAPATARFWCWRTCWGFRRGRRNLFAATAISDPRSKRRSRVMPRTCAPAHFPGPSTFTG